MIKKPRTKPVALQVHESLNARTTLTSQEKREYWNQRKGYEGEVAFDKYLESLPFDCRVLNDLRLKDSGPMTQIDTVLLTGSTVYLYEVKNYFGSYEYKDDALHSRSNYVVVDPLTQIRKSQPFLHNLVRRLGCRYEVKAQVVFINPEFYLYELPREKPFLFANQLPRHFAQLEKQHPFVADTDEWLANQLSDLHIANYRPDNLPQYDYTVLKKGILCPNCFSFGHEDTRNNRVCKSCGRKETISEAIKRSAVEFQLLYPDKKITKSIIYDWCGGVYDKQRIQRVLRKYFISHGSRHTTYYEIRKE